LEKCPKGNLREWHNFCMYRHKIWYEKKYVSAGYQQLAKKYKRHQNGKYQHDDWHHDGACRIVDTEKLNTKVLEKLAIPGQTVGTADIKVMINEIRREELIDHGMYPLQSSVDVSVRSIVRSLFYVSYPSHESTTPKSSTLWRGYFDHLVQHVGLGFDRSHDNVVQYLCSSEGSIDGGILFWSGDTMKHTASRASFADSTKLEDKQLHCIGDLCELLYDLLIAPSHNVSRSPGFELWLGSFK
jgi:hypothetical protein